MTTHEEEAAAPGVARAAIQQHEKRMVGLAFWLLLLEGFFYVLPNLVPVASNFQDDHWAAFLNLAFLAHKQFGTDVVFTYGPWGFLVHPRNIAGIYGWVLFGRTILATGCCLGLAALGVRWIERRSIRVLWASSILIFAEPIYLLLPLLCLLLWREPPARSVKDRLLLHAIAFSAGLAAHTKFTCFILLALLLPPLLLRRQSRWLSVTAILSWVLFWLMAGQSLWRIPAYISNSLAMASTYSAAQAWGSEPLARMAGFLLCGLPVVLCAIAELRRPSLGSFALVCWIALYEYIILGQAIIRCDSGHIALGLVGVAFPLALVFIPCPHLWPAASRNAILNRPFFVLATFFSMVLTYLCVGRAVWILQPSYRPPFVEAIHRVQEAAHLRRMAPMSSIPPLSASTALTADAQIGVGVLPYRLSYAFENRLHLISLPTLQSVMAWSPSLSAIDSDFLESAKAPGSMYFEVFPFDRHYPSLEDPLAWRSLLTHYQPAGSKDGFLVLSRRPRPARSVRTLLVSRSVRLGENVEVPSTAGNIVWAEIEAHRNWRGKLQMIFFNFQRLVLDIETPLGSREFFFQDANAISGFVLSPNIDSEDAMKSLYTPGGPANSPQRVNGFILRGTQPAMESFSATVQVRLYSLSIQ